jgi:hypothetical protein
MCHKFLKNSSFFITLYNFDLILAQEMKNTPCLACGGKLDQSNYQRKPRGGREDLEHSFNLAFSFCCRQDGCRKRHRAASTRFLGRFVYFSTFIILATCMFNGITKKRSSILQKELGIDLKVLKRWKDWWENFFAQSSFWKAAKANFLGENLGMPNLLFDYFLKIYPEEDVALEKLLHLLAPFPRVSVLNKLRTL